MQEIAARQTAGQVVSDAEPDAAALGTSRGLTPDFREKLRRELFGAAAGNASLAGAAPAASPATDASRTGRGEQRTARFEPGGRSGATADIPDVPLPVDPAAAGSVARPTPPVPSAGQPAGPMLPSLPAPAAEPAAAAAVPGVERPKGRPAAPVRPILPPDGQPARPTSGAPAETRAAPDPQVAEAQRLLAALGFAAGTADGRPGKRTIQAVRSYQKASGLLVRGRIDPPLLAHLRATVASPSRPSAAAATAAAPRQPSLSGRVLGGVQRLIGHDFNSAEAPEALLRYCRDRADEWIYDRGEDRMRLCAEINGGRVAYRPLPGDR